MPYTPLGRVASGDFDPYGAYTIASASRQNPRKSDYMLLAEAVGDGSSVTLGSVSIPQTHQDLLVVWHGDHESTGFQGVTLRFNADAGASNYGYSGQYTEETAGTVNPVSNASTSGIWVGYVAPTAHSGIGHIRIPRYTDEIARHMADHTGWSRSGSTAMRNWHGGGWYNPGSDHAITSLRLIAGANWSTDSLLRVYGLGSL